MRRTTLLGWMLLMVAAAPAEEPTPPPAASPLARARGLSDVDRLPLYREHAARFPEDPRGWCNLAVAQARTGDLRGAGRSLDRATALDADRYEIRLARIALDGLGRIRDGRVQRRSLGDLTKAEEALASLAAAHPARREPDWIRAWIALQRGSRTAALERIEAATGTSDGETAALPAARLENLRAGAGRRGDLARVAARWTWLERRIDRALLDTMPVFAQPPGTGFLAEAEGRERLRTWLPEAWPERPGLMGRVADAAATLEGEAHPEAALSLLRLAALHRRGTTPERVYERGQRDAMVSLLALVREATDLDMLLTARLRPVLVYVDETEVP